MQDFSSHSNWADAPAPDLPLGTANPPGLNMPRPAQLFNFLAPEPSPASVPRDLTTGCYYLDPDHPNRCQGHVRHGAPLNGEDTGLNKDGGKIDPRTGQTSGPSTYRARPAGTSTRRYGPRSPTPACNGSTCGRDWRTATPTPARHG